jgi:hypothetical protein
MASHTDFYYKLSVMRGSWHARCWKAPSVETVGTFLSGSGCIVGAIASDQKGWILFPGRHLLLLGVSKPKRYVNQVGFESRTRANLCRTAGGASRKLLQSAVFGSHACQA